MHDPAMAYTRKTKRLDTILMSAEMWDAVGVSGYEHMTLAHAGDHKAVLIHIPNHMRAA